jgi:hypothetical protein
MVKDWECEGHIVTHMPCFCLLHQQYGKDLYCRAHPGDLKVGLLCRAHAFVKLPPEAGALSTVSHSSHPRCTNFLLPAFANHTRPLGWQSFPCRPSTLHHSWQSTSPSLMLEAGTHLAVALEASTNWGQI